jgi:hypothetical protein
MIEAADEAREVSTYELVDTNNEAGLNRRRRWPEALKRQIVASTRMTRASASVVARRHDVNANKPLGTGKDAIGSTDSVVVWCPHQCGHCRWLSGSERHDRDRAYLQRGR